MEIFGKVQEDWVLCRVFYKSRTTAPIPASDDAASSLSSDLPELLPMDPVDAYAAAYGHTPSAPAMDGWHGQQDSAGQLLPAAHHRPPTPLPFKTFRELLNDMVEGCGGPRQEEFPDQGWGDGGCMRQSGTSQTWNPL